MTAIWTFLTAAASTATVGNVTAETAAQDSACCSRAAASTATVGNIIVINGKSQ